MYFFPFRTGDLQAEMAVRLDLMMQLQGLTFDGFVEVTQGKFLQIALFVAWSSILTVWMRSSRITILT